MKQVFHPAQNWEEYKAGMWRQVSNPDERNRYIEAAADLMREPDRFLSAMLVAIERWPISCEHQLTNQSINHQAWLGHAGCCIETESPEDCTRLGWHTLTKDEQDAANDVADQAYAAWEKNYLKTTRGEHAKDLFGV